jgi:hypothetical protein
MTHRSGVRLSNTVVDKPSSGNDQHRWYPISDGTAAVHPVTTAFFPSAFRDAVTIVTKTK